MKRDEEFYEGDRDQVLSTAGQGETMQDALARRWSRPGLLRGGGVTGMVLTLGAPAILTTSRQATPENATPVASPQATPERPAPTPSPPPVFATGFQPIQLDEGEDLVVAANHVAVPFLRWGDPIVAGAPEWDIANQTADTQEQQFGYNCDWIGFLSLPVGSETSDHGLLVVNHEYTNPELMFPGYLTPNPAFSATPVSTPEVATPDAATPVSAAATPVVAAEPEEILEFLTNPT
jgi:secreted PhoX family phosphatase